MTKPQTRLPDGQVSSHKLILLIAYLLILSVPGVTWVKNSGWSGGVVYGLARLAGLYAFTLMTLQVGIGGLADKLRPIFGARIIRWHIWQGTVAFSLAMLHPVLMAVVFGVGEVLRMGGDAVWGKIALNLLIISVLAGAMRAQPWLVRYWRWVHRLNYVILAMVWWHSWRLGTDTHTWPMAGIYLLAPVVLVWALTNRLLESRILRKYGYW